MSKEENKINENNEKTEDNNDNENKKKEKRNLYDILGVEQNAKEKEITSAYRKLALKYHPDRNRGSEEAAERFKEISAAYSILSDPDKRHQYDLLGEDSKDIESLDISELGGIGRVLGAMLSKLGIPIPTQINQNTLTLAYEIVRSDFFLNNDNNNNNNNNNNINYANNLESPLRPMQFISQANKSTYVDYLQVGSTVKGKIERQEGKFWIINVTEEMVSNGFAIVAKSSNKSKFKFIIFDNTGSVRYQEDSVKSTKKKNTEASFYFTHYKTSRIGDPLPLPQQDDDLQIPLVFNRLDTLHEVQYNIEAGKHLICLYGDNFFHNIYYEVTLIPLVQDDTLVNNILDADERLLLKRDELSHFKDEYINAVRLFEKAQKRLEEEEKAMKELINNRNMAYQNIEDISLQPYQHINNEKNKQNKPADVLNNIFGNFWGKK